MLAAFSKAIAVMVLIAGATEVAQAIMPLGNVACRNAIMNIGVLENDRECSGCDIVLAINGAEYLALL